MAPPGQYIDDANRDDALDTMLHNVADIDWVAAGVRGPLPPDWRHRLRQQWAMTLPIPNAHPWPARMEQLSTAAKHQRLESVASRPHADEPGRSDSQRAEGGAARQPPRTFLKQSEQEDVLRGVLRTILAWSTVTWNEEDRRVLHAAGRRVLTECLHRDRYITKDALRKALNTSVKRTAALRAKAASALSVQQSRQRAASLAEGSQVAATLTAGGLPADAAQVIGSNVAATNAAARVQLDESILQNAVSQRLREKSKAYMLYSDSHPLVYTNEGESRGKPNAGQRDIEIQCLVRQGVALPAATHFIATKISELQTRLQQGESPPGSGHDSDSDSMPHMG
jgi:hypothetical protein